MGKHWTDEEVLYLKQHWNKTPCQQIARHLGKTFHAVKVKAKRLELGPLTYTKSNETLDVIRQHTDKTARELAEMTGVTHTYVRQLARSRGIKLPCGHAKLTTPEEDKEIAARYDAGERVVDIAKDYPHLPYDTVYVRACY